MPVEIRELIVKAVITADCPKTNGSSEVCPDEKEIILAECVEKVLQIMKEKQER